MDRIDRLGWAAGASFVCQGVGVGLRSNDAAILDRLRERLPPGCRPSDTPQVQRLYSFWHGGEAPRPGLRRLHLLYGDAARLARAPHLDAALDAFESDLRLYVAERARGRVFVHAGVVGWRGRALVMPGRSFSGKSTLVSALVAAGAVYYSDEYAVLDPRGRVHAFPAPLSLRGKPGVRLAPAAAPRPPLPVGLVALARYRPAARWRPRRLRAGQGALALLAHAVPARRRPDAVLSALAAVAAGTAFLAGPRGEAAETAAGLLRWMDGAP